MWEMHFWEMRVFLLVRCDSCGIRVFFQYYNLTYLGMYEGSSYLLDWVNTERLFHGSTRYLSTFAEFLDEQSVYQFLVYLDAATFEHFQSLECSKKQDILDTYLERELGKRMKWSYKQKICELTTEAALMQFTKLVCYLSIQSKNKNDFINRILELSEGCQRFLMEQMQAIDSNLENITEIKEIIQQIELLEQENEDLKIKLKEMSAMNAEMLELVKDCEEENKTLIKENTGYRKQKYDVFAQLQIENITEYLDAYRRLKDQNQRNLQIISIYEEKLDRAKENYRSVEERVKSDAVVISTLEDQISRFKQILAEIESKYEFSEWLSASNSRQNMLRSAGSCKQNNISKCKTSLGKSMQVPTQWPSFQDMDQAQTQKSHIRIHNQQLMTNLEQMYKKYNNLNNQNTQLRHKNTILRNKNKSLRRIIQEVEHAHQQFQERYQAGVVHQQLVLSKM